MFPVSLCDSLPRIIIVPITVINRILFLELYLFFVRIIGCLFPPAACEQQRFEHEATVCLGFCGRMLSSSNYSVMCSCYWGYLFPRCWQTATFGTRSNTMFRFAWMLPPKTTYVDSVGLFCFVLFFFPVPSSPLPGLVRTKKNEPRTPYLLPLSPPFGVCVDGLRIVVCLHTFCVLRICICFEVIHKRTSIDHRFNTIHSLFAVRTSWIFSIPFLLVSRFLPRRPILFYCVCLDWNRSVLPHSRRTLHITHTYTYIRSALPTFTQHTTTYQDTRRRITEQHQHPQDQRSHRGGAHPTVFCCSCFHPQTRCSRGRCSICENWKDFGSWVTVVIFDDLRK